MAYATTKTTTKTTTATTTTSSSTSTCSGNTSSWSVIVHSDLAISSIGQHLRHRGVKLKRAESVLEGSVIFPKAKVAFLVVELTGDLLAQFTESKNSPNQPTQDNFTTAVARMDKFARIHGHCYILLQAPLFTERELAFLYHIQTRFLGSMSVDILMGHSADECVSAMLTIASLQAPPMSDKLHQRFCQLLNQLVEPLSLDTLTQIAKSDEL